MKLAQYSFLIFIFLKQFYIFESGNLQPGDLFLLLSFSLYIVSKKSIFCLNKIDYSLALFLFSVIFINLIYYYIYIDTGFIMSTLHYIFSFIVVIVFRKLLREKLFIKRLVHILKLNLGCQFLIFLVGLGEFYGGFRYMGTFNDPNQFAFFVYITLMLIIITSYYENKKVSFIYYAITLILIFESSSTGMLLAISSFIFFYFVAKIWNDFKVNIQQLKFNVFKVLFYMFICLVLGIFIYEHKTEIINSIIDMPIIQRFEEKLNKAEKATAEDSEGLIEERGIDKLFLYPEKMLYGAGQGKYDRFIGAASLHHEIHSTLPSIIFSYGFIPTLLVLFWFYNNIKKMPIVLYSIFISLLLESFTLLNQRQPFFWMLFVLASLYEINNKKVKLGNVN